MQIKTRLVTVDVVATDSHGNVVRDLKPEEFGVSDGGPRVIAQFSFVDKSTNSRSAKLSNVIQERPKGFYTNQAELERLTTPPTVILLDALNTEGADLMQARRDMLRMLTTLPENTPVAVFLLEQSLVVVQGFTSDPALLRAALDKTLSPGTGLARAPENDRNSNSHTEFAANGGIESSDLAKASQSVENFEKNNHAPTMDIRVATTLDALSGLAHYLGGYKGRKHLIWVFTSFPIAADRFHGNGYERLPGESQGPRLDRGRLWADRAPGDKSGGRSCSAATAGQRRLSGLRSRKISLSGHESVAASIRRRVHGILRAPHHHPAHLFRLSIIFCPNAASHSEA